MFLLWVWGWKNGCIWAFENSLFLSLSFISWDLWIRLKKNCVCEWIFQMIGGFLGSMFCDEIWFHACKMVSTISNATRAAAASDSSSGNTTPAMNCDSIGSPSRKSLCHQQNITYKKKKSTTQHDHLSVWWTFLTSHRSWKNWKRKSKNQNERNTSTHQIHTTSHSIHYDDKSIIINIS